MAFDSKKERLIRRKKVLLKDIVYIRHINVLEQSSRTGEYDVQKPEGILFTDEVKKKSVRRPSTSVINFTDKHRLHRKIKDSVGISSDTLKFNSDVYPAGEIKFTDETKLIGKRSVQSSTINFVDSVTDGYICGMIKKNTINIVDTVQKIYCGPIRQKFVKTEGFLYDPSWSKS